MGDVEGTLCETCTSCSRWYFGPPYSHGSHQHHQKYQDFVASKDSGCFLCTWLWQKHHIPHRTRVGDGEYAEERSGLGEFKISYKVPYFGRVYFYVKCSWAADVELVVSISDSRYVGIAKYQKLLRSLKARPWSALGPNIESNQSSHIIQAWISSCENDHKYCGASHSKVNPFFPNRIIDVEEAEHGMLFLRNRDEVLTRGEIETSPPIPKPVYWTLSHRWGDSNEIPKLLKDTERHIRNGISLDELYPAFRDAALLVSRLGYRYIWIDSLCIFQDSKSDWQREAGTMVDIYRHSFCNISAASSSFDPCNIGLFGPRRPDTRLLFPFVVDVNYHSFVVWNDSAYIDEVDYTPLGTRGWVVQERFLAPRIVHFTRDQIYWECLEHTYCESDPMEDFMILNVRGKTEKTTRTYKASTVEMARYRIEKLECGSPRGNLMGAMRQHRADWGTLVSKYASCNLTNESDKLIAMSGIAKTFQEITSDVYLAGLWKSMIHMELSWRSKASQEVQVRRDTSYAPSWSWASIVGGGVYFYRFLPKPLIELVESRIVTEPPGGDPTGLLRSAELDINCILRYFRWQRRSKKLQLFTDKVKAKCYFEGKDTSWRLSLDTSDLIKKFTEAEEIEGVCVPLCASEYVNHVPNTVYLMLEEEPGSDVRFKRIGRFYTKSIDAWMSENCGPTSLITLI
ncbi:heterokaryon incompatibility protein-domain-containing protein [Jackrogersella minutella]|nr:heterokaryon incompatibility protein-domain-containing protein [Jackrogersella minutella]